MQIFLLKHLNLPNAHPSHHQNYMMGDGRGVLLGRVVVVVMPASEALAAAADHFMTSCFVRKSC